MKRSAGLASLLTLLLAIPACDSSAREGSAGSNVREPLQRDIEGYAIASCFATLDDPRLKDQGQAWAGAIVQRSRGPIEPFIAIFEAVKAEMARIPMAMGRDESNPMVPKPMPVLYCAELIDAPAIRASLSIARRQLLEAYETPR